jgi:osmotically-inducible protein OsmY
MADRYWDDERSREEERGGRRYRGEGYYGGYYGYPGEREYRRGRESGRGEEYGREWNRGQGGRGQWRGGPDDRGFFERAGDEVRSWFGDEEAQRRRMRDEREYEREAGSGGWGESRYGDDRRWSGQGGGAEHDDERAWARQWGYVEGRGPRGGQERSWSSHQPERGRSDTWWRGRGGDVGGGAASGDTGAYGRGSGRFVVTEWWVIAGPFAGRGPRGYQRSDERIKEEVCERLSQHGQLDASDMDVSVSNGEVTLSGSVRERHDKRAAEDVAESVSGVREVHNQLRVAGHEGLFQGGQERTTPSQWGSEQRGDRAA